ncbi:MAG: polyribonucleotide nucleotidyltransferase [Hyphomonadaceae bacterium]|nr:polyribonucleotide nucleotidyltransferase [Clostridia bacterium]
MQRIFKTELAGRPLTVETGKMAQLSNASVMVRYGETVVLVNATMSQKPRDGIDFFPLNVDYEERLYAIGKIPGSFMRREGRPSERAVLTSRLIDRPMRPLFPSDLRNDVSVITTVMSVEQDNSPEITAMIGASMAVCISDIPFNGPIAGVSVGLVDGEYVINPTAEQREKSRMDLTVAASKTKIVMIEAGADQVPEDVMLGAILFAHEEIKKICAFIDEMVAAIGKPKLSYPSIVVDANLYEEIKAFAIDAMRVALDTDDKTVRDENLKKLYADVHEKFDAIYPELISQFSEVLYKLQKYVVRRWLLDDCKRVDGRGMDELRKLEAEVDLLPRTHGSGMFTRGQTQVLTVATLGALGDQQMLDGIDEEEYKRYMHHYNFPSYSVGETRPSRGPGRREIGHGALAERSLIPVLPDEIEFPYAIRLVSEVLSSNGSTSQGSVCGSSLALMDAGVPIKAAVAGISVGLITEGDRFITMLDIQGLEDFFGDMDFKVAGTKKGITSIQMDLKNDGLTSEIVEEALTKTRDARYYILDEIMAKAIDKPRAELSQYAPKIITININPDKIREVIGPGGKIIQKIIADTGVKIDIEDDGRIFILTADAEAAKKAVAIIEGITKEAKIGEIYKAKVVRLMAFGAFVEFLPGKEGLVHISKLDTKRVDKVEDVVNVGDEIMVKVMEVDKQGRINLSRKDAMMDEEKPKAE